MMNDPGLQGHFRGFHCTGLQMPYWTHACISNEPNGRGPNSASFLFSFTMIHKVLFGTAGVKPIFALLI
jgi:hypothetical protein